MTTSIDSSNPASADRGHESKADELAQNQARIDKAVNWARRGMGEDGIALLPVIFQSPPRPAGGHRKSARAKKLFTPSARFIHGLIASDLIEIFLPHRGASSFPGAESLGSWFEDEDGLSSGAGPGRAS